MSNLKEIEDIRCGNSTVWLFESDFQLRQNIFMVIWIILICMTLSFIIPLTISYSFYSTNHAQIRSESLHHFVWVLLLTIFYLSLIALEFEFLDSTTINIINNFDNLILTGNIVSGASFVLIFLLSLIIIFVSILSIKYPLLYISYYLKYVKKFNVLISCLLCITCISLSLWIITSLVAILLLSLAYPLHVVILVVLHITFVLIVSINKATILHLFSPINTELHKGNTKRSLKLILIVCGIFVPLFFTCLYAAIIFLYTCTIVQNIVPNDILIQGLILLPSLVLIQVSWMIKRRFFGEYNYCE